MSDGEHDEPVSEGMPEAALEGADATVDEAFLSRVALIEDQPLGDRAAAFGQLVEELRAHLEGTDGESRRPGT